MADYTNSTDGEVSSNPVIRLWPDGPSSSLAGVGPEITFGSPSALGPEGIVRLLARSRKMA
jgi:hypothetical protein